MRGKDAESLLPGWGGGITPAHAGKSIIAGGGQCCHRDHPRACGEKHQLGGVACEEEGSPPRMRGKADGHRKARRRTRITPAHAGKSCHAVQAQIVL